MSPFAALRERLRLPLIAAPMFRVSGVDLVAAACRNWVIGEPRDAPRASSQRDRPPVS